MTLKKISKSEKHLKNELANNRTKSESKIKE